MAPASIIMRLTECLVAGYETYGFKGKVSEGYGFPEVIDGIVKHDDYPGDEFFIGGKIVKDMGEDEQAALRDRGVTLKRDPRKLIDVVAAKTLGA